MNLHLQVSCIIKGKMMTGFQREHHKVHHDFQEKREMDAQTKLEVYVRKNDDQIPMKKEHKD